MGLRWVWIYLNKFYASPSPSPSPDGPLWNKSPFPKLKSLSFLISPQNPSDSTEKCCAVSPPSAFLSSVKHYVIHRFLLSSFPRSFKACLFYFLFSDFKLCFCRHRDPSQLRLTMWVTFYAQVCWDFWLQFVSICFGLFSPDLSFFFCGFQHLDSPDNNPDLPWEFSGKNKEKVSWIDCFRLLLVFFFSNVEFGLTNGLP